MAVGICTFTGFSKDLLKAEDLSNNQSTEKNTTIAVDIFKNGKRANKKSKHEVQFGDSKLNLNYELTKRSDSFSSVDVGLRNVEFAYRKMHPQHYTYGYAGINAGIKTEDNWAFKGLAKIEVPTKAYWNIPSDSRFIFGFEGAYALDPQWNLFLGIGVETGMRATNVQPIIGAQYLYKDWVFHAVYPSPRIIYKGIEKCQLSINFNQLYTAVRTHKVHQHRKGVALIQGTTGEFRVDYEFSPKLNGWLSAGRIYRARVTTGNKNFHNRKRHNVYASTYGQVGLSYKI